MNPGRRQANFACASRNKLSAALHRTASFLHGYGMDEKECDDRPLRRNEGGRVMNNFKETDVVSVFTDRTEAEKARDELLRAGFRSEQIELVLPEEQGPSKSSEAGPKLKEKGGAALGGLVGAAIGCLLGTLAATGVVPGVPAILGGGGLAGVLGLIAGAVVGGFLGAVIGWALEADQDSFYARELEQGRTLMTVHHCNGRSAEAATILRQNQASAVRTVSDQRPIDRRSAQTAEPSA